MKIAKFLVSSSFRINDKGDTLYYPWGLFGSGYILDTPARKKKITYVSSAMTVAAVAIIIVVYNKVELVEIWWLLPPIWLCHLFVTKWLTGGLTKTTDKITFRQNLNEQAMKAGFAFLIFMLILSIGMMAMFIWIISINSYSTTGLLMLMASFASCFLWVTLILKKAKHT
ncbi:MAG: hypothetical protein V7727_20430 [Sneathiella sp.]